MEWDDAMLLAWEVDAVYGLVPGTADRPAVVTDKPVQAVWAWSPRARLLALGPAVSGLVGPGTALDDPEQPYVPEEAPRALTRLAEALDPTGRCTTVDGGPTFVFPWPLPAPPPAPLPLLVSDAAGRRAARQLDRPGNWQPDEWAELISGAAGSWAMAVDGAAPVSICHTPEANATAAEAGAWTRADFRGRGLAPAVVAAWARRAARHKEVLFYSTGVGNRASRSVARTLGLTPLGWLWTLR
ncbi:GNAT family N-acetyltransferase [Streptomyces noursei]|uniref:GNAT family N-acetyltransferase n=1 Tax=Streptomyces noursei TaxID=1971 RepID=UPI0023B82B00|nr:GNAT family N-acetyltransferase [Streptomyces noursei]